MPRAQEPDSREPSRASLGPLETEVMRVAWSAHEPLSVRAVLENLNEGRPRPLAYTTVMTVMNRLVDKGAFRRRRAGRGYVYEPTSTDAAGMAVRRVVDAYGDAAVAHFVEAARDDPRLLGRLQRLLDEEP